MAELVEQGSCSEQAQLEQGNSCSGRGLTLGHCDLELPSPARVAKVTRRKLCFRYLQRTTPDWETITVETFLLVFDSKSSLGDLTYGRQNAALPRQTYG